MLRKKNVLICLAAVVLCVAGIALAKGAVKTDLRERTGPNDQYGSGPEAGWAIANTNADGLLIVNAHLDSGEPYMEFTVWVVVNDTWLKVDLGTLTTNKQGKGNSHLELTLSDYLPEGYSEDTVSVRVVVDNWYPGSTPLPYIGYATSEVNVALK
jgi:hypothetical protein